MRKYTNISVELLNGRVIGGHSTGMSIDGLEAVVAHLQKQIEQEKAKK